MVIVELAVRTRLLIEHIDHWIMSQDTIINKRKRSIYPIVRDRREQVDSLSRLLAQLGLQRVPKSVKSLAEYIESKSESEPAGS